MSVLLKVLKLTLWCTEGQYWDFFFYESPSSAVEITTHGQCADGSIFSELPKETLTLRTAELGLGMIADQALTPSESRWLRRGAQATFKCWHWRGASAKPQGRAYHRGGPIAFELVRDVISSSPVIGGLGSRALHWPRDGGSEEKRL